MHAPAPSTDRPEPTFPERILDALDDPVLVTDESRRLVYMNAACRRLLAAPPLPPELAEAIRAQDPQALEDGAPHETELLLGGDQAPPRVLAVRRSLLLQPDGRRFVVTALRELTAERRTEAELVRAREEALRASRAKSDFLAVMSHEMRTPLAGVLGLAELLGDTSLDESQRDMTATLRAAAETLLALINDLLDLSKIEAGQLEVVPAPFDLQAVLRAVDVPMALRAQQRGLAYGRHLDPATPGWLLGDAGRLQQVLRNLAANAVKFTEHGRVEVRVGPAAGAAEAPRLRFEVQDTGPGIPPERQDELFQPFVQLQPDRGGSGLGLAISRRLVEAMGGRIGLESRPGEGSCFWFELPLPAAAPPAAAVQPAPGAPARPLHVLLAEDDPTNQQVALRSLQRLGHRVDIVASGCAALRALAARRYDLVLMDLQMPEMDGLEATRRIRAGQGVLDPQVPVIGLTAFALSDDRGRCLAAGMDDHVPKPYRVRDLAAAIARLRPEQPGPASAADEAARARPPAVFDRTALEERVGLEPGVLGAVVETFVEEAPRQLAALAAALDDRDLDALRRRAHQLKGAAGSVGAMRLWTAAALLEREARCCETEHLGERLEALERELEALRLTLTRDGLLPEPAAPGGGSP